jgi:hypothetical protein
MNNTIKSLSTLVQLLGNEAGWIKEHAKTQTARRLNKTHDDLLNQIRKIGKSADLSLMVAAEKTVVQNDLSHHANSKSKSMVSSLKAALSELDATQKLLAIVDDKRKYAPVNESYSLSRNREKGLPLDEARQAFKSHYARLNNMDKSCLSDDEKKNIDARKTNMFNAGKLYAQRQAKTLDVAPEQKQL